MHICTYKHAHLCTLAYIYPLTQTNTELTSIYDPADQIYQQHISVNQKTLKKSYKLCILQASMP